MFFSKEKKQFYFKQILNYRNDLSISNISSNLISILKLIPLIAYTHNWKIIKNTSILGYTYDFLLTNHLTEMKSIFVILSIICIVITILPIVLMYVLSKIKFSKKLFSNIFKYSFYMMLYVQFFLVQYVFEIFFNLGLDSFCMENNCESNFIYLSLSVIMIIITIFFNLILNIMLIKPYFIKDYPLITTLNSYNIENIIFSLVQGLCATDYHIKFNIILIIKIIFRCLYLVYYIKILRSPHTIINFLEFFLKTLSTLGCIVDFVFLFQFTNIDLNKFNNDPSSISITYDNTFILVQLFLEIIISILIVFIIRNKIYLDEIKFLDFKKTDNIYLFSFYNKLLRKLYNFKNEKIKILEIYEQVFIHLDGCKDTECICRKIIDDYNNVLLDDKIFDKNSCLYNKFLNHIEEIISENIDKTINSDSYYIFQMRWILLLINWYFKNHYSSAFFLLQRLESSNLIKKNFLIRIQIYLLKNEIINDFVEFNKNINNKIYHKMYKEYKNYKVYQKIEKNIENCINLYINFVQKISENQILSYESCFQTLEDLNSTIEDSERMIENKLKTHITHQVYLLKFISYYMFLEKEKFNNLKQNHISLRSFRIKKILEDSDVMVIKHTKEKEFIIDYVTPNICEELKFCREDLTGRDLHDMMPDGFKEIHYKHVSNYINNNNLSVSDKEIFFIDGDGNILMYVIGGSVLLTLNDEFIMFSELYPLSEEYKKKNITFLCCNNEGDALRLDSRFSQIFIYNQTLLNIVRFNFFEAVMNMNNYKIDKRLKNNIYVFEMTFKNMIDKIGNMDYTRLCDYDNIYYTYYLRKFENITDYYSSTVQIRIEKKNLANQLFFYLIKIRILSKDRLFNDDNLYSKTLIQNSFSISNEDDKVNKTINIFSGIKYLTLKSVNDNQSEIVSKLKDIYDITPQKLKSNKKLLRALNIPTYKYFISLLFFLIFCVGLIIMSLYRIKRFQITEYLANIHILTMKLFYTTNYLSVLKIHDIFTLEPSEELNELPFIYQDLLTKLNENYLSLPDSLREVYKNILDKTVGLNILSIDWRSYLFKDQVINSYKTFFTILKRSEKQESNIDINNYPYNKNSIIPTNFDRTLFFILENVLYDYKNGFIQLEEVTAEELIIVYKESEKEFMVSSIMIAISLLVFFIWKIYEYINIKYNLLIKVFSIINIIRYYNFYLYTKLTEFQDLMNDFTISNYNKMKKYSYIGSDNESIKKILLKQLSDVELNSNKYEEFEKRNKHIRFKSAKNNEGHIRNLKERIIDIEREDNNLNNSIGHVDKSQSILINKDEKKLNDEFVIKMNNLHRSKLYYFEIFIFIAALIILYSTYIIGLVITDRIYGIINEFHIQDDYFMKKYLIFNQLILIYQVTYIKKQLIIQDDKNIFLDLKNEYFHYVQKMKLMEDNELSAMKDLISIEENLNNENFCDNLIKLIGKDLPNCISLGDGINSKGYDNMIYTMYQNLFFLYDDIFNKIDKKNQIDVIKISNDKKFNGVLKNYIYVMNELSHLFINMIDVYVYDLIGLLKLIQKITLILLVFELFIIFIYYAYLNKQLIKKRNILNKIEKIIEHSINCSL